MNKQFEEWLKTLDLYRFDIGLKRFKQLPFSMQWGVYLAFFDSVNIIIEHNPHATGVDIWIWEHDKKENTYEKLFHEVSELSRQEAQQEAIKKAFEILEA